MRPDGCNFAALLNWSLRDYGIPPSVWGGDAEGCEHEWGEWQQVDDVRESTEAGKSRTTDRFYGEESRRFNGNHEKHTAGQSCARCGAWRGALGMEPAPDLFVQHIVEVFREVRRVLRKDGTCWVNLGDSYASGGGCSPDAPSNQNRSKQSTSAGSIKGIIRPQSGLKPKDLVGIPWMVAFALRADGWYLRQDIIWAKPNPMPESVRDRCTKAHEYLFLLSKSGRYYYDAKAIEESAIHAGEVVRNSGGKNGQMGDYGQTRGGFLRPDGVSVAEGRNKRSVWTIPTAPFPEAHFATFPPDLVKPCVLAGSSEMGCCAVCGAPWAREVERETTPTQRVHNGTYDASSGFGKSGWLPGKQSTTTTGWARACEHDAPAVPCTVLDPFMGSGTTAMVAKKWGRRAIGIDLNQEYLAMAVNRIATVTLPMLDLLEANK